MTTMCGFSRHGQLQHCASFLYSYPQETTLSPLGLLLQTTKLIGPSHLQTTKLIRPTDAL